jgi:hypothetical protein
VYERWLRESPWGGLFGDYAPRPDEAGRNRH